MKTNFTKVIESIITEIDGMIEIQDSTLCNMSTIGCKLETLETIIGDEDIKQMVTDSKQKFDDVLIEFTEGTLNIEGLKECLSSLRSLIIALKLRELGDYYGANVKH